MKKTKLKANPFDKALKILNSLDEAQKRYDRRAITRYRREFVQAARDCIMLAETTLLQREVR